MTIEIGTREIGARSPDSASDDPSATRQELFEALRKGEGGVVLLRKFLGDAKLSPEQEAFVDLLAEWENRPSSGGPDAPDDSDDGAAAEEAAIDSRGLRELRQELADLREANDTVAAALGACPYCWGGDPRCEVCRGRGRAGFRAPDPGLFNELVLPAIQRARAMKRAGSRPRARGARA